MNAIQSARTNRSQLWQTAKEMQDYSLYSFVTLPAAINASNGILFFGDTESTVGRQRTNMTRANEVPGKTNFEIFGIGLKFAPPLTVLWTTINDAIRDAFVVVLVNQAERRVYHAHEFFPATAITPSFSAAAGDNPVVTHQGGSYLLPVDPSIVVQGGVQFIVRVFFATNVAALGSTVMGVVCNGLIDRGDIQLDATPIVAVTT